MTGCLCTSAVALNEVVMLALGAILGLVASLCTMLMQRQLDKRGKLNIFYRFSYQKGMHGGTWGFNNSADGRKYFVVPVVFEFQNTSNETRVIRDVSMHLYSAKEQISKMRQIDHIHTTTSKSGVVDKEKDYYFGTDKGSYSFVIPPRSIQRQECQYLYVISVSEVNNNMFDRVKVSYFDERNRKKCFEVRKVDNCWENRYYPIDEEWQLLK